ncbi:unnamed protein product [Chondrus crispus]|uniref:Uncharacterized protein n=1 Tax=Chondrus crispus TaxID=2769 RepID=R7QMR1_CHOCR|nr:unnamed protein product [Chondrus crispus]CDF38675.1 unnamed protein product [Chondrus crispus]|eukprot:XP_005718580.1 unnamed protein product [Chondrus crispus]
MKHAFGYAHGKGEREVRRAAGKISGYYLLSKARQAMAHAGVLGETLSSLGFDECTSRLETPEAQKSVDLVFQALGMRNKNRLVTRKDTMREQMERRVLLSSIVVSLHPEAVMEEKVRPSNPTADVVSVDSWAVYTARRMLLCLHVGTLGAVANAWLQWRRAFTKWKKNDAEVLLRAMIEDAVATQALQNTVTRGFNDAKSQERMRTSLGGSSSAASARQQEQTIWGEQISRKQEMIKEAVDKFAGPRGLRRLQAALAASRQITDERVIHEIMIDLPGLLAKIQSSPPVPEDAWRRLQIELSKSPPEKNELARRLLHLSNMLNSMIEGCFVIENDEVTDELNGDFAIQLVCRVAAALEKCQAEAFDEPLREWVNDTILKLQSAGEALASVVVDTLRQMTDLVEKIHHSIVTFRIQRVAPVVQQYGAAWERSSFQGHVMSGEVPSSFPQTRNLFSEVVVSVTNNNNTSDVQDVSPSAPLPLKEVIIRGIIRLIMKSTGCSPEELPEFMRLDQQRIVRMQNDFQGCALLASLDNIAKQFISSKGAPRSNDAVAKVVVVLESESPTLRDIQNAFMAGVSSSLSRNNINVRNGERELLEGIVENATRPSDKTLTLMMERMEHALLGYSLRAQRVQGSARIPISSDVVLPPGLEGIEERVKKLSRTITRLADHLLQVHGSALNSLVVSI